VRLLLAGALVLLAACSAGPEKPAKRWTTRDFLAKQGQLLDFGGWQPGELLTPEGGALPFQPGVQAGGPGLTLFPAISEGEAAAFVITDLWQDHPQPWVQPVWIPLDENGTQPEGVRNVFPVDVDATFYSPFWRAEWILTPGLTPTTYQSARDVLSSKRALRDGTVILCPLVPEGTSFANDGTGPRNPMTLATLSLPRGTRLAWVDGVPVSYLNFGADRAPAYDQGQGLVDAEAYFFVSAAGERPLPLAAVLPADPLKHSFVRRIDVVLPGGAAPFVPSNRPELRRLLEARGLVVPDAPAALDGFASYALRVARDPACFGDPNFPAACDWLDSEEKLDALPGKLIIEQPVQLAIGVVLP
jgi:hypothetical protein